MARARRRTRRHFCARGGRFGNPDPTNRYPEIEELQSAPEFWTNAERAQRFVTEMKDVRSIVEPFRRIATAYEELAILGDMAKEAGESEVIADAETALATIEKAVHDLDFRVMLGGPNDHCGGH